MRPVFVHNSKQYDIVTMQINENNVREICYYDGTHYKFVCEKNDYTKDLEMVENLTSHIKWIGRYDELLDELIQMNEKKNKCF